MTHGRVFNHPRFRHGFAKMQHPLYRKWKSIKGRCSNSAKIDYEHYGGRNIKICDEWRNDFTAFYEWAISNGWNENLEIDRINNDGNYEPENCRFVNHKTNCLNKRLLRKNNNTGYCGVHKSGNKFRARIVINGKRINLGIFNDPFDAAIIYDHHAIKANDGRPLNVYIKKKQTSEEVNAT